MTKLHLALSIINRLRIEKDPPLLRYCALLTLAEANKPMRLGKIYQRFGMDTSPSGTLPAAVRAGLVSEITIEGHIHYQITPAGQDLVRDLLTPDIPANK
jgi:hypothetical protein